MAGTSTGATRLLTGHISVASAVQQNAGGLHFIVVGAGGNGARVVPPLMQILHPGDHMSIIDHDVVEERNLGRQHFATPDVGRYKALVLASRYRRRDVPITAYTEPLDEHKSKGLTTAIHPEGRVGGTIIIGCVDNAAARRGIKSAMLGAEMPCAWVDVGNAYKDGQVILSLHRWPMSLKVDGVAQGAGIATSLRGMEVAMPQLLRTRPEEAAEESCRDRVDLQSVMINVQAASAALNVISWLKLRGQIMTIGAFFTSMCVMQPIKIASFDTSRSELLPEDTYATQPE